MNFSLNSLSFAQRLLFITAVPVVGLTAFTLVILFDHIAETRELNSEIESVAELSELSAQLANTIHEWQKERGRSAGFIGSGGTKFSSEIRSQHESTDNLMADLEEIVHSHDFSKYGGEFQSRIDRGKTLMSDIEEWRSQILRLEVPASKAVGYYTSMINNYLDLIESIPQLTDHSEISLLVVSYAKFLRAKENMGIERAVLSNAFGADAFKGDFFIRYCTVIANQKSYLYAFKAFAKPEHIAFYQETVRGPQVDKVAAWEKLAFDKAEAGGFGVDPSAWFAEITGKIDLMKEVEDHISKSILSSSAKLRSENSAEIFWFIGIASAVILLSLGSSLYLAHSTTKSLKFAVETLKSGASETLAAASQVALASNQMAIDAQQQSQSLDNTSDRLQDLSDLTTGNTTLAEEANTITAEARQMAEGCLKEMDTLRSAMTDIQSSSDEISAIIKTIDEIAFQTNILALNAAVEAARAGESGAGFAVVADEVRNLAQRSAQAASETAQKIEDSIQRSSRGGEISSSAGSSLERIVEKVREVDNVVAKITSSSEKQLDSIASIKVAVESQEDIIISSSSSTDETATAAQQLQGQVKSMQECIVDLAQQTGKSEDESHATLQPLPPQSKPTKSDVQSRSSAPVSTASFWD